MPSTRGASRIGEVDGGFAGDVVLVRDAFEVKLELRLFHFSCSMRAVSLMSFLSKAGRTTVTIGGRENAEYLGD